MMFCDSGGDPARVREHRGERLAKPWMAFGIRVRQQRSTARADRAAIRAPDQVSGREPHVHARGSEEQSSRRHVVRKLGLRRREQIESGAGRQYGGRALRSESAWPGLRKIVRDERAARAMRDEPPLGHELIERGHDGETLHADRARQGARAGQGIAGTKPAAPDVELDRARDLRDERNAGAAFEWEGEFPTCHAQPRKKRPYWTRSFGNSSRMQRSCLPTM